MEFDGYTIALLIENPAGPQLDDQEAAALQDEHLSHLADLHEAGHLLVAGPLAGEKLRGLSILNVEPERARELTTNDPAVRRGVYTIEVIPWMVPHGAMHFTPARLPRSVADARGE